MKKTFMFVAALLCICALDVFGQRTIGNSRDQHAGSGGDRNSQGRPVESRPVDRQPASPLPTPTPTPVPDGTRPHPHPSPCPILIDVSAPPSPPVIIVNVLEEEKVEVIEVVLRDNNVSPERSGFDFSANDFVRANDKTADLYFSISEEGPEFVVSKDADIQDLGQDVSFIRWESVPAQEWSPTHRVHAEAENVYIVWTWDNQYYKFRVVSLADSRVSIEWMKMDAGARIAANDGYRNGEQHRDPTEMFGR